MNGAFESPSATEALIRIPCRESSEGDSREGVAHGVEVCLASSLAKAIQPRHIPTPSSKFNRRKHGQSSRRDHGGWNG